MTDPSSENPETTERTVRAMLAAAGLPASEAEVGALVAAYPVNRAGADALYQVPAARYVDPALRFRAAARLVDWW